MEVINNFSLKTYNTFGIGAKAGKFATFRSAEELASLLNISGKESVLILGGGSNILLTQDFDGLVLKNEMSGIEIVKEDDEHVYVKAGAGESWHRFVLYCIGRDLAGVENLSLIPGNIGASPMQNIGAYGVEIKDVFHDLEAFQIKTGKVVTFSNVDCEFGYRESIFKSRVKGEYVILSVTYRLNKTPEYNTSYGAIAGELERMGQGVSIQTISQAVINIRSSKLPDPAKLGNAGSFFKNPTLSPEHFERLKGAHPNVPAYPQEDGTVKIAAGWLIEQCGWKGFRRGDAGCHASQALVLVNYGNATGREIYELSEEIKQSVLKKFDVTLEREVNIV